MNYPVMTVGEWNDLTDNVRAVGASDELLCIPEVELLATLHLCDERRLSCDECTESLVEMLIRQMRQGKRKAMLVNYIAAIKERTGRYHLAIWDEAHRRFKNETPRPN